MTHTYPRHRGHPAQARRRGAVVVCDRLDSRLRPEHRSADGPGRWNTVPYDRFHAEVRGADVTAGLLVLDELAGIGTPPARKTRAGCRAPHQYVVTLTVHSAT